MESRDISIIFLDTAVSFRFFASVTRPKVYQALVLTPSFTQWTQQLLLVRKTIRLSKWNHAKQLTGLDWEDSEARKNYVVDSRKQNVFETQTVGRNEQAAKTEQAINPKKRSDSIDVGEIIVFHGRCFIVISLLIASTGLVLVLTFMFRSPLTTWKDPTVHSKTSTELHFVFYQTAMFIFRLLLCLPCFFLLN